MWDFVMNKSGAGEGFLRELRFPLPMYIPFASPQSSSLSPEAGTIGQEWPQCQYPHKPNNNKKIIISYMGETRSVYKILSVYFERMRKVGISRRS
jgi:hypothetical protein